MTNKEIFNGICPYTDKLCEEWNCIKCEVEKAERDYLENEDKSVGENVMNIEVNFDNLTKEEQEQFNALVEKANTPKSKVWMPAIGETYYNIANNVYSSTAEHEYVDDSYDNLHYAIGNCFRTEEEAEFALERLKVIAEMKRYIAEHDDVELDWDNHNKLKYYLVFNRRSGVIDYVSTTSMQAVEASLCASIGSVLLGMVKEIGLDRIKKYYFGVGEN